MKTKLAIAVVGALLSASALAAPGVDGGTVTFNGTVVANSCDISVAGGSNDGTVELEKIAVKEFSDATGVFKKKSFDIVVKECAGITGDALQAKWVTADADTGSAYLNNVSGTAENVNLVLLSGDTPIVPGADATFAPASTDGNSATFTFDVGYAAPNLDTAAPTPGSVVSTATYSIVYN